MVPSARRRNHPGRWVTQGWSGEHWRARSRATSIPCRSASATKRARSARVPRSGWIAVGPPSTAPTAQGEPTSPGSGSVLCCGPCGSSARSGGRGGDRRCRSPSQRWPGSGRPRSRKVPPQRLPALRKKRKPCHRAEKAEGPGLGGRASHGLAAGWPRDAIRRSTVSAPPRRARRRVDEPRPASLARLDGLRSRAARVPSACRSASSVLGSPAAPSAIRAPSSSSRPTSWPASMRTWRSPSQVPYRSGIARISKLRPHPGRDRGPPRNGRRPPRASPPRATRRNPRRRSVRAGPIP